MSLFSGHYFAIFHLSKTKHFLRKTLQHIVFVPCKVQNIRMWCYPEYSVDVNTTGWARMIQLKPLIQAKLRTRQKARERKGQAAQGLYTVIIFHLAEHRERDRQLNSFNIQQATTSRKELRKNTWSISLYYKEWSAQNKVNNVNPTRFPLYVHWHCDYRTRIHNSSYKLIMNLWLT